MLIKSFYMLVCQPYTEQCSDHRAAGKDGQTPRLSLSQAHPSVATLTHTDPTGHLHATIGLEHLVMQPRASSRRHGAFVVLFCFFTRLLLFNASQSHGGVNTLRGDHSRAGQVHAEGDGIAWLKRTS